jgi:superfamily II DNA/RNA helicase
MESAGSTLPTADASRLDRVLADFQAGKVPVLVATDVAARGLHIDAVDVVIHYDPAEDQTAYLHRSGRTARAGETGIAVTLMLYNQENIVRTVLRRLSLDNSIVEVFSNDARLTDLRAFDLDDTTVPA